MIRYKDLTPGQKKAICNGCGPAAWKGTILLRTINFLLKAFRLCCGQHDFHYWRGGSEVDRILADGAFLRNMNKVIDKTPFLLSFLKPVRRKCAQIVFEAVRKGGKAHFSYGPMKTQEDLDKLEVSK